MDPIQALKEATDAGIVKGLRDISGVKPRLDIDVMIRDQPDTFNLFILALDKMQKPDFQPSRLRYAEISGNITPLSNQDLCLTRAKESMAYP